MKKRILFLSGVLFCATCILAQIKPEIRYDEETGNYIFKIQYEEGGYIFDNIIFEPATKIDPYVNSCVNYDNTSKLFLYRYTIRNGVLSIQRLLSFSLDYRSLIENFIKPNNEWMTNFFHYRKTIDWAHVFAERINPKMRNGIPIDSTVTGFRLSSKGLPSIFTAYFEGDAKDVLLPEEPPEEIEIFLKEHQKFPANTVQRKTLGPKDPPTPFIPAAFLDTLVSYTRQSRDLGWITDQAVENKYENNFSAAQTALQQNRITETRESLNQVLEDVQSDSGTGLTSESYALLRYNTEYLLSQLQESEVSLDDLIAYIKQAQTDRKIDTPGLANSLISKLETAKKQLEKEKTKQTVNALNAFLNELEAQHEKHISDEVYVYLKEKVTALITQLESSG